MHILKIIGIVIGIAWLIGVIFMAIVFIGCILTGKPIAQEYDGEDF